MVERKRQFKAGHRDNAQLRGTGKMSENRFAWVRVAIGQFTIMKFEPEETDDDKDLGASVVLFIPRPGSRGISYDMTALTSEELKVVREFFNMLFDEAEPVVSDRDRIANEALAAGDDSHARVYRQVPQFVVRKRPQRKDSEGVHDGSQNISSGDRGAGDPDCGVGRVSDELADCQSKEAGTEDDG